MPSRIIVWIRIAVSQRLESLSSQSLGYLCRLLFNQSAEGLTMKRQARSKKTTSPIETATGLMTVILLNDEVELLPRFEMTCTMIKPTTPSLPESALLYQRENQS
jgi:hypothetical protein